MWAQSVAVKVAVAPSLGGPAVDFARANVVAGERGGLDENRPSFGAVILRADRGRHINERIICLCIQQMSSQHWQTLQRFKD